MSTPAAAPLLPAVNRAARAVILLTALAQGLWLYQIRADRAPTLAEILPHATLITLLVYSLSLPVVLALRLTTLREPRVWLQLVGIALVQVAMIASALWASDDEHLHRAPVWLPLAGGMALALFVALPWLQAWPQSNPNPPSRPGWPLARIAYADLFELAWHNALCLLLALLFIGIGWALLMLWGALFNALQVTVFLDTFEHPAFFLPAFCVLGALGVLIARTQQKPLQLLRQVLFALCKGLLPLVTAIVVLFAASLPVTGLTPLWQTGYAATLLTAVVAATVVLLNAVWQDGRAATPYARGTRCMVELGLLLLPVCAVLAVVALGLRIDQYGWTVGRFWGALVTLVACGYALGYAAAVLRGWLARKPEQVTAQQATAQPGTATWLAPLGGINRVLSLVVIALAVLANTPVLDATRIAARSQIAQLRADPANMRDDDLKYLRFKNGRRGVDALRRLRDEPLMAATAVVNSTAANSSSSETAQAQIDRILAMENDWGGSSAAGRLIADLAALRAHILVAPDSAAPDDGWWQRLLAGQLEPSSCRRSTSTCVLRRVVLDDLQLPNPSPQVLLCLLQGSNYATCRVHGHEADATGVPVWRNQGYLRFSQPDIKTALQHAPLTAHPHRWPRLQLGAGEPEEIGSVYGDEHAR